MQGQLLAGRYRLADAIGSGGMGRVWRAHDEVLHRAVAIKELTAALYVAESDQAVLLARTRAEARAAARINHSAVVTVHDVLEHDGRPWIVMELVEGQSLADAVKERGRVEPAEAARVGLWVLRALCAAHAAGVLHRDVKPGNVLLSQDGRVLLTDFGIAQIEGDTTITRTGEVVGSVDYLAPERVRGHDPGPSSDLWALGATLYTAVEGLSPFRRTSPLTTMQAVVDEEPRETRHAGVLAPVITALLRKDPAARPDAATAERMLAEAAEGRRSTHAQAYIPTQYTGQPSPHTAGTGGTGHQGHQGDPGPHGTTGSGTHGTAGSYAGTGSHGTGAYGGTGAHGSTGVPFDGTGTPAGGTYPGHRPAATGSSTVVPGAAPVSHHPATAQTPVASPAAGGSGGDVRARSRGRRLRNAALVVVLAAVIGGGTAVVLQEWGPGSRTEAEGSGPALPSLSTTPPSPTPRKTKPSNDSIPAGWKRVTDPYGFSIALPGDDWKRVVSNEALRQVDYTPDGGQHFIRVAVTESPEFPSGYDHQKDLEEQLRRLVDYRRVMLEKDTFRDRPGALWEYSWTALPKDTSFPGPRHAIEETYFSRSGVEYAIYMSSPEASWPVTRSQFKSVLQSWRPGTD
ncbi:serine/threonine protein kinase [Streptomyces sp. Tu 6176]|uniref:serine/threonine-protein kinase n=1 Tax=Streptomyces sp. Tu 6176 TaxID=1470557 RepID=UPI0004504DA8|nr:serine/threonine-protein kinase [Streptomyces sp. Tu 6176]EYT84441.1 serine/threonine protein kinase [Streptomyces sp. Tu 6176]